MNEWLQEKIENEGKKVLGHFAEQYLFAVEPVNQVRISDHVIRFENLSLDFDSLMAAYSMQDIRLEHGNTAESNLNQHPTTAGKTKLDVSHLSAAAVQKIRDFYGKEMAAFGYNDSAPVT